MVKSSFITERLRNPEPTASDHFDAMSRILHLHLRVLEGIKLEEEPPVSYSIEGAEARLSSLAQRILLAPHEELVPVDNALVALKASNKKLADGLKNQFVNAALALSQKRRAISEK